MGAGGPHHNYPELIAFLSFNQPIEMNRGRSHELVASMVGCRQLPHSRLTENETLFPGDSQFQTVGSRQCSQIEHGHTVSSFGSLSMGLRNGRYSCRVVSLLTRAWKHASVPLNLSHSECSSSSPKNIYVRYIKI